MYHKEQDNDSENLEKLKSKSPFYEKIKKTHQAVMIKVFPSGCMVEFKLLLQIMIPVIFLNILRFMNPLISVIVCGHLNRMEFDAASLANSMINVFGVSFDLGFSTAFDTLFAQVYGSDNKKKMGHLLQRGLVLMSLLYLFLACLHLNIEPILILLRQDPLIAELCTTYMTLYLPGLFFEFQFLTLSRYLQNQNIVYPTTISALIGIVFNATAQIIAIFVLNYGLEASAICQAISCFLMFACQLGYVLISKVYQTTWDGWALKHVFGNWKIIFILGLPGIVMIAAEEWNFEIATFVSGALGPVQLGAQSIAFQACTMFFMFNAMGPSIATTIRIGQYLGSNEIDRIKTSFAVAVCYGILSSTCCAAVIFFGRYIIAGIFTTDKEILEVGADLLQYIALIQFVDILCLLNSSLIRATGKQVIGASIMCVSYYVLGVPLGLILIFVANFTIKAMWIGLIAGGLVQGLIFLIINLRINWTQECFKANRNTGELNTKTDVNIMEPHAYETMPILHSDTENLVKTTINKKRQRRHYSMSDAGSHITFGNVLTDKIETTTMNAEKDKLEPRIIRSRCIIIAIIILLFIGSILLRVLLPKSLYLPCIEVTNFTKSLYVNNPSFLCNFTLIPQ